MILGYIHTLSATIYPAIDEVLKENMIGLRKKFSLDNVTITRFRLTAFGQIILSTANDSTQWSNRKAAKKKSGAGYRVSIFMCSF